MEQFMTDEVRSTSIDATPIEQVELTKWIRRSKDGDREAEQAVYEFVYAKLKLIAKREHRSWPVDGTMDTTSLVHEFFLKFSKSSGGEIASRGHFFNLAGRMMRQILINHAKKKLALKRGGNAIVMELTDDMVVNVESPESLLIVDELLCQLEKEDEVAANAFICKWFARLTNKETAQALDVSLSTAKRKLARANVFLAEKMNPDLVN